MNGIFQKIETYIIYATIFLLPVSILSISPNPFLVTKVAVIAYGILAVLLVKSLATIFGGKLSLKVGNFDFPVFLVAASFIASTFLRTPNKMEAILLPGTTTLVVGFCLLYFLINQLKGREKEVLSEVLLISGGVYSGLVLLAGLKVFEKIPQLPAYIKATNFSPEGGYLPAALFFGALIPIAAGLVLSEKIAKRKIFHMAVSAVIAGGLLFSIYNIIPGRPNSPRFPSFGTSWFIAVDTLKASPLLGIGPGNYLTAFNRFRPIEYNQTDLWAIKFSTANNFYLTAFTETGLLGAAGLILLVLTVYRTLKRDYKEKKLVGWGFAGSSTLISLALIIVFLAIFPGGTTTVFLLFVLLALNAKTQKSSVALATSAKISKKDVRQQATTRLPALLVTAPVLIFVIFAAIRGTAILRAENKFRLALEALARNEALPTYNLMQETINLNPFVDRYHASYSQVNLAIANAIAVSATQEEGAQITDEQRGQIAQLIQQAIREGKATVALNLLRSGNWEVLARVYQAIMPLAQGADQFAIETYRQAVALDPVNPNTRIALGGIHYARGDFDTAIRVFELATVAKPDLANGHYNLAFALREKGEIERAIQEMTLVLSLVNRDSPDYENAKQALEELESRRARLTAQPSDNLTPPQPGQEPILQPPLDLPEEAEPPEAPITPTPTPAPEAEGETPTVTPIP